MSSAYGFFVRIWEKSYDKRDVIFQGDEEISNPVFDPALGMPTYLPFTVPDQTPVFYIVMTCEKHQGFAQGGKGRTFFDKNEAKRYENMLWNEHEELEADIMTVKFVW